MITAFQSSAFQTNAFQIDVTSSPSVILLGGTPGKRKKYPSDYFFTPAWQKFDQEARELESQVSKKETELHDVKSKRAIETHTDEIYANEQIAAHEAEVRASIEAREQFLIYEQNMLREINELRIRRARLIRQMQEEEVILTILHGLPPLH